MMPKCDGWAACSQSGDTATTVGGAPGGGCDLQLLAIPADRGSGQKGVFSLDS